MKRAPEKIYWDTDCFLAVLQEEEGKVELALATVRRAEEQRSVVIFTSALAVAETVWKRNGPRLPEKKVEQLQKMFRRQSYRVFNVTRAIAFEAQRLVLLKNVRPKDAVHLATAIFARVDAFETFDADLLALSGQLGSPPLKIRKPIGDPQGEFPLAIPPVLPAAKAQTKKQPRKPMRDSKPPKAK